MLHRVGSIPLAYLAHYMGTGRRGGTFWTLDVSVHADASDAHTICYTSGTTGVPKGVVLTHGNLIANAAGIHGYLKIEPTDVYVSYLPLAHIYERINHVDLVSRPMFGQLRWGWTR